MEFLLYFRNSLCICLFFVSLSKKYFLFSDIYLYQDRNNLKTMNCVEKDILKLLGGEVVSTVSIDLASKPQSSDAPNGKTKVNWK